MKIERDLEKLYSYEGEDQIIGSIEHELILRKNDKLLKRMVRSMIPSLDSAIDGFYPGELIVISGYTKQGKTLLSQTFTVNFTKQQHFPLWFSFEVPMAQFYSQFPDLPQFFTPMKLRAHSIDWVEERILEAYSKKHTKIVFIDHLHFLFDMVRSKNTSLEIGQVVRRLKGMAVEHGFVIFLLCHTTKGKSEETPDYSSIRDSSLVSQESDTVFMVGRTPKVGPTAAQMRVEFHRRTGVLEHVVPLQKENGLLVETINRSR